MQLDILYQPLRSFKPLNENATFSTRVTLLLAFLLTAYNPSRSKIDGITALNMNFATSMNTQSLDPGLLQGMFVNRQSSRRWLHTLLSEARSLKFNLKGYNYAK
jgi:hypothetical protein